MSKKTKVALLYDFDGTLAAGNMQEYDFIPDLKMTTTEFWDKVKSHAQDKNADEILAYMHMMLEEARTANIPVQKKAFSNYGKKIELFAGVEDWFERVNKLGDGLNISVEHYIVSSGLKEMIEGTKIKKWFKRIYASSFMYDHNGAACWPATALNYTSKTQFLFRINKGLLDVWDSSKINEYTPDAERPIPFRNMVYIGDGASDVPCMKLVKEQGGYAIAVYNVDAPKKTVKKAKQLLDDNRVNFVVPADYSKGSDIEKFVQNLLTKIAATAVVTQYPPFIKRRASSVREVDREDDATSQNLEGVGQPV